MPDRPRLHVNVDHVATLRQARRGTEPDPVAWALAAERAGAQGITCHLRKDRRHVQDADVRALRERITTLLNLEMSLDPEIVELALKSAADEVCVVPENRLEITTEGGLDVVAERPRIKELVPRMRERGTLVSLFVDPDPEPIAAAAELGVDFVELHTGPYANASGDAVGAELERLREAALLAREAGLRVNAGHGLHRRNVAAVASIEGVEELNVGHSIVGRAVLVGVDEAVREVLAAIAEGAGS